MSTPNASFHGVQSIWPNNLSGLNVLGVLSAEQTYATQSSSDTSDIWVSGAVSLTGLTGSSVAPGPIGYLTSNGNPVIIPGGSYIKSVWVGPSNSNAASGSFTLTNSNALTVGLSLTGGTALPTGFVIATAPTGVFTSAGVYIGFTGSSGPSSGTGPYYLGVQLPTGITGSVGMGVIINYFTPPSFISA